MFTKILIANRGENGRAATISTNCMPQSTQWISVRTTA